MTTWREYWEAKTKEEIIAAFTKMKRDHKILIEHHKDHHQRTDRKAAAEVVQEYIARLPATYSDVNGRAALRDLQKWIQKEPENEERNME